MDLQVGTAERLMLKAGRHDHTRWESSAPQVAEVFQNGFVAGLAPGQARVMARSGANQLEECLVTVATARLPFLNPANLQQYLDSREFAVDGRKCYGSELNGQRAFDPDEKRFTRSNRIINPKPLRDDKPLDWELLPGTEVYDGAGALMGTVPPTLNVGGRRAPVSMFNFGASKVLAGRICVYAFSVAITPSAAVAKLRDPAESKAATVETSAWLPLDCVVDKETLLERIGLGKARPMALPLESTGFRVSGGNPRQYMTEFGELSIVRQVSIGAVPSHYLRRPSGTINLVYSVPGFGLGGQGTDSFLVSDGLEFYPASGAKVFKQPTYFPRRSPQAGKASPETITFIYGAIQCGGSGPVYGWIAKEALASGPK